MILACDVACTRVQTAANVSCNVRAVMQISEWDTLLIFRNSIYPYLSLRPNPNPRDNSLTTADPENYCIALKSNEMAGVNTKL